MTGSQPALTDKGLLDNGRWMGPKVIAEAEDNANDALVTPSGNVSNVDESVTMVETINYVAYGIVAFIIVAIGIVGNILNLIVLTRPKLKGVMYVYLLGLAVSNLCVLIMAIPALMDIAGSISSSSQTYSKAFFQAHLEIPLLNSFMAASVYIIICMTVNRYISIYKPTHFQRIHTFKNAYIAIFFSFLGGMILHIPLAFEFSVAKVNITALDEIFYEPVKNPTVSDHLLYRVYLWISEALLRLGPIITLTILNILIIVRFHRIAMKREVLKGGAAANVNGSTGQLRGSNSGGINPAPTASPCPPIGPPSSTMISSGATTSTSAGSSSTATTNGGNNRLSVTQITFHTTSEKTTPPKKLSLPNSNELSNAEGISRAVTPDPKTNNETRRFSSFSPSRLPLVNRGTPSRVSTRRRGLHNPEERMLVVVLIAIVILFVVCTTPAAVLSILVTEELKRRVWFSIFRACANNLELLCFALNFFVYCLCSADIRRAFVDVLFENAAVRFLRQRRNKATGTAATSSAIPVPGAQAKQPGVPINNAHGVSIEIDPATKSAAQPQQV